MVTSPLPWNQTGSTTKPDAVPVEFAGEATAAALSYVARGWPVIPLHSPTASSCSCRRADCEHPGKHPRTKHGSKDGSCDPATICAWWKRSPDANVGIVTGPQSGFFALDVDGMQGERSLINLEQRYGSLPDTLTVHTGGGGRHLYFLWEEGADVRNSQSKIAPGLDIRGQGGFVVAPPSRHASGTFYLHENADAPIAHAPRWLLQSVATQQQLSTNQTRGGRPLIPKGQRIPTLFRRGCSLRARGAELEEIESHLLQMNQDCCDPPRDESRVRRVAREICQQYPRDPARVDASQSLPEFLLAACQKNNLEFMQLNQRAKWRSPLFTFTRLVKGRPEFSGMDPSQAVRRIEQEIGAEFWERFAGGNVCADPLVQFAVEWDTVHSPAGNGGALALAWEEAQQTRVVPPNPYSPKYAQCISLLAVLQRRAGEGKRFPAPQERIGKLIGVDPSTIGNYIKLAIKDNLLKVGKDFIRQQMAREYILDLSQLELPVDSDQSARLPGLPGLPGLTDSTGVSGASGRNKYHRFQGSAPEASSATDIGQGGKPFGVESRTAEIDGQALRGDL